VVGLLILGMLASQPDSSGASAGVGGLVYGSALSGVDHEDLRLDRWEHRTRIRITASWGEGLSALAEPSLSGSGEDGGSHDSTKAGLDRLLVRARLPGTPWLGGEVFHGCRQPWMPALGGAYLDLTDTDSDSLSGMSLTAGGFLGFRGSYSVYRPFGGDTLSYARLRAPWAGFGTFRAYRYTRHGRGGTEGFDAMEAWLSIRRLSPWVTLLRGRNGDGRWAVGAQLRGLRLRPSLDLRLEVAPEAHLAGDGLKPGTAGLQPGQRAGGIRVSLRSVTRALSAWGYGRKGFEDMVGDSVGAGMHMLSRADIEYSLSGGWPEDGDPSARLDADLRRRVAGAGAGLRTWGDSLRVSGRASYSPRPDVHGTMEVSGSPGGVLDPVGTLSVRVATGAVSGGLSMLWEDGAVALGVDLVAEVRP
jgi:hypothetical protein